jgi:hypothetical protein
MYFGHDRSMGERFKPEYPEYQGFPGTKQTGFRGPAHLPMAPVTW